MPRFITRNQRAKRRLKCGRVGVDEPIIITGRDAKLGKATVDNRLDLPHSREISAPFFAVGKCHHKAGASALKIVARR
jgi:hypothetical protein